MRITPEQNRAWFAEDPRRLVDLVEEELVATRPELVRGVDDVSRREMVENALLRGRRRGLSDPRDLAAFAMISFEIAPNFDEHPRIAKALEKARDAPSPKMETVVDLAGTEAWEEAAHSYRPEAWFSEFPDEPDAA